MYKIGDIVTALSDLHLSTHPPERALIACAGTLGTVVYLLEDDPEAIGVEWRTSPPRILEVNACHVCRP